MFRNSGRIRQVLESTQKPQDEFTYSLYVVRFTGYLRGPHSSLISCEETFLSSCLSSQSKCTTNIFALGCHWIRETTPLIRVIICMGILKMAEISSLSSRPGRTGRPDDVIPGIPRNWPGGHWPPSHIDGRTWPLSCSRSTRSVMYLVVDCSLSGGA